VRLPVGNPTVPDPILVIEDDESTRYAYERVLHYAGYQTLGQGNRVKLSRGDKGCKEVVIPCCGLASAAH
jgi:hypothetical protein